MFKLCLVALLMASLVPSTALANHGEPAPEPRAHVPAKRAPCPPSVARQHPERCLPPGKKLAHKPAKVRTVLAANVSIGYGTRRHVSGYTTGLFVAPAGTAYPLTEPKPGDYICTSTVVPLDTKVVGMHSPKPYPPCGYKWAWDGGSGKGYWWLRPDPNYGVRR